MIEQPRCIMPNIENAATDFDEKWPHQIVNESCPRFAMMQISVEQGLAHRYSEVSLFEYAHERHGATLTLNL
jgi:hypothetical protein